MDTTLETPRLVMTRANEKDAKTLMRWWNDGTLMESVGFPKA